MSKDKSVIFLTIDALRSDHLKAYGYQHNTAPNLENFIQKGTTFLNAISNGPESPSSFSAIFTSNLPFLHGGYCPLPSQKITFTQILKENGIVTYGIHSNPNLGRYFNYDRGFDVFIDGERYKTKKTLSTKKSFKYLFSSYLKKILNYNDLTDKLMYKLIGFNKIKILLRKKIPALTDLFLPFTPIAYNAPYISNKIISYLRKQKKKSFLWAHFMDVHNPFNPPTKNLLNFHNDDISISDRDFLNNKLYLNPNEYKITSENIKILKSLYDGEINFVDEYLGPLFSFLRSKFKNSLLIITADHGESFFEHGYFNHQGNIFDELLKVPLFIIEIGKSPKIKRVTRMVQLIDIGATILDFYGIEIPDDYHGKSLLPLTEGRTQDRKEYVISECYQKNGAMKRNNEEGYKLISIRTQEWKYIFDEEKSEELLFNLKNDPDEKENLIKINSNKIEEFRKIRENHFQKISKTDEKTKILKAIKWVSK